MDRELSDYQLQDLFAWVDKIPLSRTKRNISRDFSDGVLAAEVVKHFFPKLADMHNYVPANSTPQKLSNWNLLNRKVFSKLDFHIPQEILKKIVLSTPGAIEPVLWILREKLGKKLDYTTNYLPNSDYNGINNQETPLTEIHQTNGRLQAQHYDIKKEEENFNKNRKHKQPVKSHSDLEPSLQLMLQEREQRLVSLQETVEILQMKVKKLEHLLHLKDVRIENLIKHVEKFRPKDNLR